MRRIATFLALFLAAMPVEADIQRELDSIYRIDDLIGMAAGMADDTRIIAMTARGVREKGQDVPVTTSDRWHIGSISKSLTTVLLGTLVAEGRLDVDTPLPELLPDIDGMDARWNTVTLRDVLEHRSGLPANFGLKTMMLDAGDEAERPALRRTALAAVLAKPPRSREFRYSNVGYTLAGHVVENLTGLPWEQALRERVFAPLGLESAGFGAPKGDGRYDQPSGHANFLGRWQRPMNPFDSRADNTPVIGPAGTVHMSLPDLLVYGQALLRMASGEDDILPAAVFADLATPRDGEYAGGLISGDGPAADGAFLWHNGSNTMWYALLVILPKKNRVVAVTVNQDGKHARDTAWQVFRKLADW